MEKLMTEENFIAAELKLSVNKPDNRMAKYISKHAERYGKELFKRVKSGTFAWHAPREKTITDSYKGKERRLKIPCLEDQAAQIAWLNVATPYIERRNYFYNCGSIPGAGQTRAVRGLQKWLKNPRVKYAATTDIRKFYDTCPHWAVRKGLERIFKDKKFIDFAMGFVASMSNTGIGIAIGYPVSHWMANIALMELDFEIRRFFPNVFYVRYMDDIAMVSTNKRMLRRAVLAVKNGTERLGMHLKKWASFSVAKRGITYLSYRFFNGYTLLTKKLMIRIARRIRKAPRHMSAHVAAGVISYLGILKHCNSYNFRKTCVYPYICRRECLRLIRLHGVRQKEVLAA